jgi:DNA mismatch repair protein MutS2
VNDSSRQASEYLRRIKLESEQTASLRQALEEERVAVAEKFDSLEKEAEKRESQRQILFQAALDKTVLDFERRSRELLANVQDRSERLKLEREAQRRVAELKREAQRAATSRRREPIAPPTSTSSRPVKVMREGQLVTGSRAEGPSPEVLGQDPLMAERTQYVTALARDIAVGDRVRLRSFGSVGIVDDIKGDEAEVRVKSLRLREKLVNLELVEVVTPAKTSGRFSKLRNTRTPDVQLSTSDIDTPSELNVIGQRADEAVEAVDKFLDAASLAGTSHLRIVHGHGTGALRRAIGELLKDHPHVARFNPAPQDQGGSGATVVELRQ